MHPEFGDAIAYGFYISQVTRREPVDPINNARAAIAIFKARQPLVEDRAGDNSWHAKSVYHSLQNVNHGMHVKLRHMCFICLRSNPRTI